MSLVKKNKFPCQHQLTFLYNILNQIGDELMVTDRHGKIIYVNEATARGLGYPKAKILDRFITDFLRPRISLSRWKRVYFNPLKRRKAPVGYVLDRETRRGQRQKIDITAVYLKHHDQEFVLSIARNITHQIIIQNQLRESELRFRLLSENAADGIAIFDVSGRITYANRALAGVLKTPLSRLIGRQFEKHAAKGPSVVKAYACLRRALKGEAGIREEFDAVDSRGEVIPVEVNISPLSREGRIQGIQAVIRDVRRRKQMDRLLRESERMKTIVQFVSGTAQEIKHPLKAIHTRIQDITERYRSRGFEYIGFKEFTELLDALDNISQQLQLCYTTTDRLLSLNTRRAGLRENAVDMNRVVRDVISTVHQQLKFSGIRPRLQLKDPLPYPAAIGVTEMSQVVTNIVMNAIQAMPGGGRLVIRTYYDRHTHRVILEIRDDGIGIPEEDLPKVFEPFFSTKKRGADKGSGLGLAIVQSLVKSVQGEVEIDSSLRKGTQVKVALPARRPSDRRMKVRHDR
ncbi:MAG: PAS domain S-box protein [Candidatus Omnitrophota bacterium]|nr:PAS domain S-box protein [Candidatus Omnitrophota bacterium]